MDSNYVEAMLAVSDAVNGEGPVGKATRMLMETNKLYFTDLVHDTYSAGRHPIFAYHPVAYKVLQRTLLEYSRFCQPYDPVRKRAVDPDDRERTFQFGELADVLEGHVEESKVWLILSKLLYFRQVMDGIIEHCIYDVKMEEIKKTIAASDFMLLYGTDF